MIGVNMTVEWIYIFSMDYVGTYLIVNIVNGKQQDTQPSFFALNSFLSN